MGLDMYLIKETYVKNWDYMKPEELHRIVVKKGGHVRADIKPERISNIVEEVCYWRKANAIHKWFVDHVQEGKDECQKSYVTRENLKELLETVGKVLDDHDLASELLPAQAGFFFGGTDYDEYYFEDLKYTKKKLEEVLAENGDGDFYYESSW